MTDKPLKAGGDFAEEIVGHWQLWAHINPTQAEFEALKDKIRQWCVPKSALASDNRLMRLSSEAIKEILDLRDEYFTLGSKAWYECESIAGKLYELKSLASDKSELRKRIEAERNALCMIKPKKWIKGIHATDGYVQALDWIGSSTRSGSTTGRRGRSTSPAGRPGSTRSSSSRR